MKTNILTNILFITMSLLFATGCSSLVNDIDPEKLPKTDSKLVVECYLSPQLDSVSVVVTESRPLLGDTSSVAKIIKNARVTLKGPLGEIILPFLESRAAYKIPASLFKIEAGKTYQLTVSDQTRSVKASCTVPSQSVALKRYVLSYADETVELWDSVAQLRLYWDDPANQTNYYDAKAFAYIEHKKYSVDPRTGIKSMSTRVERSFVRSPVLSDANIDGLTINSDLLEFRIYNETDTYTDANGKLVEYKSDPTVRGFLVEILNTDENYYKFHRTLEKNSSSTGGFTEPTFVYSNIEGGLGCFGAFNASTIRLKP